MVDVAFAYELPELPADPFSSVTHCFSSLLLSSLLLSVLVCVCVRAHPSGSHVVSN